MSSLVTFVLGETTVPRLQAVYQNPGLRRGGACYSFIHLDILMKYFWLFLFSLVSTLEYSMRTIIHLIRKRHLYPLKIVGVQWHGVQETLHGLLPRSPLVGWSKLFIFIFFPKGRTRALVRSVQIMQVVWKCWRPRTESWQTTVFKDTGREWEVCNKKV